MGVIYYDNGNRFEGSMFVTDAERCRFDDGNIDDADRLRFDIIIDNNFFKWKAGTFYCQNSGSNVTLKGVFPGGSVS